MLLHCPVPALSRDLEPPGTAYWPLRSPGSAGHALPLEVPGQTRDGAEKDFP